MRGLIKLLIPLRNLIRIKMKTPQQIVDIWNKNRKHNFNPFFRLGLRFFIKDFIKTTEQLGIGYYQHINKETINKIRNTMRIKEKVCLTN